MSNEQQTFDILKQVGFSRNESKFLFYLFNNNGARSREIELGADLRQPEVSVATTSLVDRKLIKITSTKNTVGKGRPLNRYFLTKPHAGIVKDIDDMFLVRLNTLKKAMADFNSIFIIP